jgi:hypothetical protein
MPRSVQQVNTLVRSYITVYNSNDAPVTGLTNVDFTKFLAFNSANSVIVVTVSEIGNGRYVATFTPNANGAWYLLVQNAANNPRGWDEEFDVNADGPITVDQIMDQPDEIEIGFTLRQTMRLMSAILCGKASGGPGNSVFRNMPDTANRVVSVANASGDRTVMTLLP